jgi:hypothetical protein
VIEKEAMILMKIELPLFAVLALIATDLMARVAVQGLEQALFSTLIHYWFSGKK